MSPGSGVSSETRYRSSSTWIERDCRSCDIVASVARSTTHPPNAATVSPAEMDSIAKDPQPFSPAGRACAFGVSQL